uniref:Uncharacterized protein n=1 Tax=Rhizophora mucronata TaxID=61149 RepID=A0A2P2PTQ6_RHIMU
MIRYRKLRNFKFLETLSAERSNAFFIFFLTNV